MGSTSHFTVELRWDPPERMVEGSTVTSYSGRYNRIDPKSGEPLTTGNEKYANTNKNNIILKDMAAGGTYHIKVKVETTNGSSAYSAPATASAPMIKTELDQFRDSLNLPDIEKRLEGMSTKNETERKLASLQTLINGIDNRTSALEKNTRFDRCLLSDCKNNSNRTSKN